MTFSPASRWTALLVANGLAIAMLGLYSTSGAAPQAGQPPFANSIEQRAEMVQELRETKASCFTLRDTPMFTCRQRPLADCLDALG